MPAYQLHRLEHSGGDPEPVAAAFYNDQAAMRAALAPAFPAGCDIWRGGRFVARVLRPSGPAGLAALARPPEP